MRRPFRSSCLIAVLAFVGLVSVNCADTEFLDGVACDGDRECGPRLDCQHGFCGGCPQEMVSEAGQCLCPGDRIFSCQRLDESSCMPLCESAKGQCHVAVVSVGGDAEEIRPCGISEDEQCFSIERAPECMGDGLLIVVDGLPEEEESTIIANCPPPEAEESDFDCERE